MNHRVNICNFKGLVTPASITIFCKSRCESGFYSVLRGRRGGLRRRRKGGDRFGPLGTERGPMIKEWNSERGAGTTRDGLMVGEEMNVKVFNEGQNDVE